MLRTLLMRSLVAPTLLAVSGFVMSYSSTLQASETSSTEWQADTTTDYTESVDYDGSADYTVTTDCAGGNNPHWCGLPAPSYPVPYATPRVVGHTNFTYPPLMPHHSLPHYRHTYSFRHGPGLSRTNVSWHKSYLHSTLDWVHHLFELPR
jgi:hypothetical protein